MELKNLFGDEDAVSPVIGVILMVAITVILAAVIGTFVLGLGDRVNQASPSATFSFDYSQSSGNITVDTVHDGGDSVAADQVNVTVGGQNVYGNGGLVVSSSDNSSFPNEDITAGDGLTVNSSSFSDGDAVKIIWKASGSDKTAVIGESEVNV
ncbi:type IV pilin [Halorussus pelagicus]|uniref:type IV pilin n=1 Tax=Halorussus pelagicus TaxID=2505977 RepID=UPI000FFBBB1E|nr:type IV pilin N-terminal domain-containing protein [Halorussus pelagicus]